VISKKPFKSFLKGPCHRWDNSAAKKYSDACKTPFCPGKKGRGCGNIILLSGFSLSGG
jgi:hypothetical protein